MLTTNGQQRSVNEKKPYGIHKKKILETFRALDQFKYATWEPPVFNKEDSIRDGRTSKVSKLALGSALAQKTRKKK